VFPAALGGGDACGASFLGLRDAGAQARGRAVETKFITGTWAKGIELVLFTIDTTLIALPARVRRVSSSPVGFQNADLYFDLLQFLL
jgi:hypothetical protein